MPNCPVCKNPDHVYMNGRDPIYGKYVLCSLHGIQVETDEEKITTKEGS